VRVCVTVGSTLSTVVSRWSCSAPRGSMQKNPEIDDTRAEARRVVIAM
jgi:hypothetical protein